MRKKLYIFLLYLLILSINIGFGNGANKVKIGKASHAKHNTKAATKVFSDRMKRSLYDDNDVMLWSQRGKELAGNEKPLITRQENDGDNDKLPMHIQSKTQKQLPFWGNRGRRDSSSAAYFEEYPVQSGHRFTTKYCKNCYGSDLDIYSESMKEIREELPFWGNRGRRSSEETDEPFWGNRGRRQDNHEEPFWGNRGRRQDEAPFWGNRGRRDEEPFWGNRGRREEEPFWGNRGRREEEPFWGNRGRREDVLGGKYDEKDKIEPFWGSRGRRQESEPFWGNRGRREESEPFWGNRGRRKQDLKESILDAINDVQGDIESLSRLRRSNLPSSFWANRARDSKLKYLFNGPARIRLQHLPGFLKKNDFNKNFKPEPGTVLDSRIYAEEPHYIIVDRSSRSSAEDDPYFISRGKKYFLDLRAARDRRGAIEEIVKSVRNDPYYIARGKKNSENFKVGNSSALREEFAKAKDLICSTIELILIKNEGNKTKREMSDDRDRRTILKKLAAQLQMDPYFVSRGKKADDTNPVDDNLEDFINEIAAKCD